MVESVNQPAEEKQAIQGTGTDRPLSQCSAAEEKPAAGEGTNSKSSTGKGRPASNVAEKVAKPKSAINHQAKTERCKARPVNVSFNS